MSTLSAGSAVELLVLLTIRGSAALRFDRRSCRNSPEIPSTAHKNQPLVIESRVFHKFLWSTHRLVLPAAKSPTTVFCGHRDRGPTIWSGVRRRSSTCAHSGQ